MDLKECSRVTLPKPTQMEDEANIEMRRNAQIKVYEEYRSKNTINDKGEQEPNLTAEEQDGIETLRKKTNEKSNIIMKTDKSSRFVATTVEKYVEMGSVHTSKDTPITRREISYNAKVWNSHYVEWAKMYKSGENLGHMS